MKLHPAEEDAIVRMSQRFSAARVDFVHSKYTPDWSEKQGRTLAISAKLKGIKDLVIDGHDGSILLQVLQLACHLLPQAEVCKMKFQCNIKDKRRFQNAVRDHFSTAPFQLAKCDFLTDLHVEHCYNKFLSRVLLESKHLKRLSIEDATYNSRSFNINGTSVWELVTFKLEKSLQWLLETQPNIETINFDCGNFLNEISHDHLHKFRVLVRDEYKDSPENMDNISVSFGREVPEDIDSFESNVLAFFERETNIPGLKNSHTIKHLYFGSSKWVRTGATLSDEFILNAIEKTPNIESFEIRIARTVEEIKRTIDRSGLNLDIKIHGTDGGRRFVRDGGEYSSEEDEADENMIEDEDL
jgi:hypothetical protein